MFKEALIGAHRKLNSLVESGELNNFALIGAMALSIYTEPRSTADIDFVISPKTTLQSVAKKLKGTSHLGDVFDPLAGSISFALRVSSSSVPIQCVQFHPAIEALCFENVQTTRFEKTKLRSVSAATLVILKLYAGSALDIEDARKVLASGALDKADRAYLKKRAQALRLTARLNALERSLR